MGSIKVIVVVLVVAAVAALLSVFTVDERELAIKFRLGEIVRTEFDPGLHFKIPFVNNVKKFDGRILTLDAEPERFLTAEKKNVIVDSFVKWRIVDVAKFYNATGGSEGVAKQRMLQIVNTGLKDEFGKRTIQEVVSGERALIMDILTENADRKSEGLGVSVLDVRIRRIDLPKGVSESVYQRMAAERERVAREIRARGSAEAERIRADADRQRQIILAEAFRDAEVIRGEGDARAAEIYSKAFTRNEDFYGLYRSLAAYRKTFASKDDVLVLEPDTEFFDYFKTDKGKPK
ncbi:MAG: protease modulator HflC [Gammaproteobacteria bacterium]|nr:protease modulator HflC [Gammaproteobacteria bacterium]